MTTDNNFIANSFQTANIIVDRIMPLLEPAEFVVFMFAVRHIVGWHDIKNRQTNISISSFEKGHRGMPGCGLSRPTIVAVLGKLQEFGLLAAIGRATSKGQKWELLFAESRVNWQALEDRQRDKLDANKRRTQAARKKLAVVNQTNQDSGQSDLPASGQSDLPYVVNQTNPLKHTLETNKKKDSAATPPGAPEPEKQPTPEHVADSPTKAERDAIFDAFVQYGMDLTPRTSAANAQGWRAGPITSWLLGSEITFNADGSKQKVPGYTETVTPNDVRDFFNQWHRQHPGASKPTTPAGFVSHFPVWHAKKKPAAAPVASLSADAIDAEIARQLGVSA